MILYEAKIMSTVCCGHPNLPSFMGVYDCLAYLVTKYYSVDSEPITLHKERQTTTVISIDKAVSSVSN